MHKVATLPQSGPITQGVVKKTIPLFHGGRASLTEELPGCIVSTSAVAEISQRCLYRVCDVWVTSCLEKEEHGFLFLLSAVCQPAGVRERGRKLLIGNITSVTLCLIGSLTLVEGVFIPLMEPREPQAYISQMTAKNSVLCMSLTPRPA